jgi:lysyl-tRNA synthetase class I
MSTEDLERTMKELGAPNWFSKVRVTCRACGKVRELEGMEWMEAVANLAIAFKCPCGQLVGMTRRTDSVKFVEGTPDLSRHLPGHVSVVTIGGERSKKPWWKFW